MSPSGLEFWSSAKLKKVWRGSPFDEGSSLPAWRRPALLGLANRFPGAGYRHGAVARGCRWIETRWDLTDEDFSRIWIFCTLLFLGAAIYAFTSNEGPADFR